MSDVNQDVFARVKKVIESEIGKKDEEISLNASFGEDLGADSLDQVQLVMGFEDEFSIDIPDEDVEKIKTVKDAVDYISKKLDEAA
ncbi:MAG: acyl carrier protein [Fimbriimonadales bacterium]